jgi:glycerophosphoryl diester phosphodiesterase
VVRLQELADTFPDARLNIDPKHDAAVPLLASVVRNQKLHDRVCLASFDDARLRWLRAALGPSVLTALSPREVVRLLVGGRGLPLRRGGRRAVQVPLGQRGLGMLDERLVAVAHAADLPVHVWTVDDEPAMHRLLDLGVDGIMTDRPTVLRRVLEARGQWTVA